jgi:hypothetical protein
MRVCFGLTVLNPRGHGSSGAVETVRDTRPESIVERASGLVSTVLAGGADHAVSVDGWEFKLALAAP